MSLDDVMSHNELATSFMLTLQSGSLGKENEEERPLFQILFTIVDCLNIAGKNFEEEIFPNLNKIF